MKKSLSRSRRRRAGFTLMEVLLVMVILVILGSLVGVAIRQTSKNVDQDAAKIQIGNLADGIEQYSLHMKRYPTTEQGLEALVSAPSDLSNPARWRGPYLADQSLPLDPWDGAYQYESQGADDYRIWSSGPDGVNNTDDDIASDDE